MVVKCADSLRVWHSMTSTTIDAEFCAQRSMLQTTPLARTMNEGTTAGGKDVANDRAGSGHNHTPGTGTPLRVKHYDECTV